MLTQTIHVMVSQSGLTQAIDIVQGDTGRAIECIIDDMQIPKGAGARIYGMKPSGNGFNYACSITGNTVVAEINEQMSAEYGHTLCQISIENDGKNVSTFEILLNVKKSYSGEYPDSGSEVDWLEKYLEEMKKRLDEYIESAQKEISESIQKVDNAIEDIKNKAENGEFSATVKVGSVTTGEPGSAAVVENVGTGQNAIFNFLIPRGYPGPEGPIGPTGPVGPPGESGITTPVSGFYTLSVDDNGDLWAYYEDAGDPPAFEYDSETGNLYYNIEE